MTLKRLKERVNCKKSETTKKQERLTNARDEVPFVLKKGAVVAAFGNVLRATEIEIDGVAGLVDHTGRAH